MRRILDELVSRTSGKELVDSVIVTDDSFAELLKWNGELLGLHNNFPVYNLRDFAPFNHYSNNAIQVVVFTSNLDIYTALLIKELLSQLGNSECFVLTSVTNTLAKTISYPKNSAKKNTVNADYSALLEFLCPHVVSVLYFPVHGIQMFCPVSIVLS
mgnify:CR=1 FL=1